MSRGVARVTSFPIFSGAPTGSGGPGWHWLCQCVLWASEQSTGRASATRGGPLPGSLDIEPSRRSKVSLPLYRRILGERFEALPEVLRRFHDAPGGGRARGSFRIERGRGWLRNGLATLLG